MISTRCSLYCSESIISPGGLLAQTLQAPLSWTTRERVEDKKTIGLGLCDLVNGTVAAFVKEWLGTVSAIDDLCRTGPQPCGRQVPHGHTVLSCLPTTYSNNLPLSNKENYTTPLVDIDVHMYALLSIILSPLDHYPLKDFLSLII